MGPIRTFADAGYRNTGGVALCPRASRPSAGEPVRASRPRRAGVERRPERVDRRSTAPSCASSGGAPSSAGPLAGRDQRPGAGDRVGARRPPRHGSVGDPVARRAARQLSLRGDRQALPAHLDLFAVGAAQSLELRPVKTPGGRPEVELVDLRPILLVDLSCRKRSTGTATMSGGGCRSGAARTASATSGTAGGRSAGRPAGRRRYGVTSKRLLNGFSSGSFSQLEKPASCVSSLALAGGSPQVPSPAPPFASDVVMQ